MIKYDFKNVSNLRDLGGYKTKYNHKIKEKVILRSNIIENLELDEIDFLLKNNIKTIIDLRSEEEIIKRPSFFQNDKRFSYYNIVLKGKNAPLKEKQIPEVYMEIVDDKEPIKKILNILLKSQGGILYFCNLGKDRTGIISMILLLLAGVDNQEIIGDYYYSDIYLKDFIEEFHKKNPNIPKYLGRAKKKYMEKTLELFYDKYNNINNYMKYIGIKENELKLIINKIIEN